MNYLKRYKKFNEEIDFDKTFKVTEGELFLIFNDFLLKYLNISLELVKIDGNSFNIEFFNKEDIEKADNSVKDEFEVFKRTQVENFNKYLETIDLKVAGTDYDGDRNRFSVKVTRLFKS